MAISKGEDLYANLAGIGGFMESGSNSNGSWVKFPDGTLICTKRITHASVPITTTSGGVYMSNTYTMGGFAYEFTGNPNITLSISESTTYSCWLNASAAGTYAFIRGTSGTATNVIVNIHAIGRWKPYGLPGPVPLNAELNTTLPVNLSTEEQVVGTGLDGKPLYQKTILVGAIAAGGSLDVPHGVGNITNVDITRDRLQRADNAYYPITFPHPTALGNQTTVFANATIVGIRLGANVAVVRGEITIQYQKTTD